MVLGVEWDPKISFDLNQVLISLPEKDTENRTSNTDEQYKYIIINTFNPYSDPDTSKEYT